MTGLPRWGLLYISLLARSITSKTWVGFVNDSSVFGSKKHSMRLMFRAINGARGGTIKGCTERLLPLGSALRGKR